MSFLLPTPITYYRVGDDVSVLRKKKGVFHRLIRELVQGKIEPNSRGYYAESSKPD
ncbi:MAG: hypothetical protein AB1589_01590 [Cyanobacteriota bacterium]